eukprot:GHVQ01002274.1.p1 GENE.GHVQ01002274.1~~GHVQ01002274.1.p1  ORF type:complete len:586 (+),score=71.69 GHVQ01002274.1:332-2089(+)
MVGLGLFQVIKRGFVGVLLAAGLSGTCVLVCCAWVLQEELEDNGVVAVERGGNMLTVLAPLFVLKKIFSELAYGIASVLSYFSEFVAIFITMIIVHLLYVGFIKAKPEDEPTEVTVLEHTEVKVSGYIDPPQDVQSFTMLVEGPGDLTDSKDLMSEPGYIDILQDPDSIRYIVDTEVAVSETDTLETGTWEDTELDIPDYDFTDEHGRTYVREQETGELVIAEEPTASDEVKKFLEDVLNEVSQRVNQQQAPTSMDTEVAVSETGTWEAPTSKAPTSMDTEVAVSETGTWETDTLEAPTSMDTEVAVSDTDTLEDTELDIPEPVTLTRTEPVTLTRTGSSVSLLSQHASAFEHLSPTEQALVLENVPSLNPHSRFVFVRSDMSKHDLSKRSNSKGKQKDKGTITPDSKRKQKDKGTITPAPEEESATKKAKKREKKTPVGRFFNWLSGGKKKDKGTITPETGTLDAKKQTKIMRKAMATMTAHQKNEEAARKHASKGTKSPPSRARTLPPGSKLSKAQTASPQASLTLPARHRTTGMKKQSTKPLPEKDEDVQSDAQGISKQSKKDVKKDEKRRRQSRTSKEEVN